MPYPNSSDVAPGQPTAAAHYNTLRSDALRFGTPEPDSVLLGALFSTYVNNLKLAILDTDRLRITATPASPVAIVIDGYPLQATSNVDLAPAARPSGSAGIFYVFANRNPLTTTFTITVNSTPTPSPGQRRIGYFFWTGTAIDRSTILTLETTYITDILDLNIAKTCNGRLTLVSGLPITLDDVPSAGAVYFTPYEGNQIALRTSLGSWKLHSFPELTITLSGIAANKNVDIFIYDANGSLKLETSVWASNIARATDIYLLDGVPVKLGNNSRRFLGTIHTSASGVTRDTVTSRLVANYNNRQPRKLFVQPPETNWVLASTAGVWRVFNADTANSVEILNCVPEITVDVLLQCNAKGNSTRLYIGLGVDSTDTPTVNGLVGGTAGTTDIYFSGSLRHVDNNRLGYHVFTMLETCRTSSINVYGTHSEGSCSNIEGYIWT